MTQLPPSKIKFNCDFCGQVTHQKRAQYNRKVNHFCGMACYAKFRKRKKNQLPVPIVKVTVEEFKKEYPDTTEGWADSSDFERNV